MRGQVLGDVADVLVLGAAGQDFVADDQEGGGDDLWGRFVHGGELRRTPQRLQQRDDRVPSRAVIVTTGGTLHLP